MQPEAAFTMVMALCSTSKARARRGRRSGGARWPAWRDPQRTAGEQLQYHLAAQRRGHHMRFLQVTCERPRQGAGGGGSRVKGAARADCWNLRSARYPGGEARGWSAERTGIPAAICRNATGDTGGAVWAGGLEDRLPSISAPRDAGVFKAIGQGLRRRGRAFVWHRTRYYRLLEEWDAGGATAKVRTLW